MSLAFPGKPLWKSSEILVFLLFLVLVGLYATFLPTFEGPDEIEHYRYIQGHAKGVKIHPVDERLPLAWGYQVHHPPLYYRLTGYYARLVKPRFPWALVVNSQQNPRFPHLRHDIPGQKFPFDDVGRGLRLLRLPSVVFGVLTFFVLSLAFRRVLPHNPAARSFLLAAAMLAPNTLQIFSTVANDGLNLLLSSCLLFFALKIVQESEQRSRDFLLAGLFAGLALWTKLTGMIAIATAGTVWGIDALVNRRYLSYAKRLPWFIVPLVALAAPYFIMNFQWYGDPTREILLRRFTPAFYWDAAAPVLDLLGWILDEYRKKFAADLCYQSVTLKQVSPYLLWPWLLGAVLPLVFVRQLRRGGWMVPALLMSLAAIFWGVFFLVLANRHWGSMQVRHMWCVYPFTFLSLALLLDALPVRYRRWSPFLLAGTLIFFLSVNAVLLRKFEGFHRASTSTKDRDYATFMYTYIKDRAVGKRYLNYGR